MSDLPNGEFEIELRKSGKVFNVPPDSTILQVLMKNGVYVPVSCTVGECATCLTRVIEGIPDHRDSIQTDEEKATNEFITVCCSRSLSKRLVLDL